MDIVTLAAARKSGGSGGDVTKQYVDDHLALKADKTETAEYPIASTTTGINPTITDSADGYVQDLTVYGRSRVSKNILDPSKVMSDFDFNNDVFSNILTDTHSDFRRRILADGNTVALSGDIIIGESHLTFSIPATNSLIIEHNGDSRDLNIVSLSNVPAGEYVWSFNFLADDPTTVGGLRFSEMMICTAAAYEADPTFEPYGIISIGEDGELNVQTIGKNLIPSWASGYINTTDGKTVEPNLYWTYTPNYIALDNDRDYVISADITNRAALFYYDATKNFISVSTGIMTSSKQYAITTKPAGTKYIRLGFNVSGASVPITAESMPTYKVQVELGSTATAYEPYISTSASLSTGIPLYSVGDVKDELDERRGVIVKRCEKKTLDNLEWTLSSNNRWMTPLINAKPVNTNNEIINAISNNYTAVSANALYPNLQLIGMALNVDNELLIRNGSDTDTPTGDIVYELAEPYEIPLTSSELSALRNLRTYNPTTNVTITDNPTVDVGYLLNTDNGQAVAELENRIKSEIDEVKNENERSHFCYSYKIDMSDSNPATCVKPHFDPRYGCDNFNFTSAHMDYTNDKFDYGSWEGFIRRIARPCMLKYDGTVDYYLDPDDYSKKITGEASDVADVNYQGNAMVELEKLYFKRYTYNGIQYCFIADRKLDKSFKAYAHHDKYGRELDYIYRACYDGMYDGTRLRSISGIDYHNLDALTAGYIMSNTTRQEEMNFAKANNVSTERGEGWNILHKAEWDYINDILILIGMSTDTQGTFGRGRDSGYVSASDTGIISTGTMDTKGLFWGENNGSAGVKVLGFENPWANIWKSYAGWMLISNQHYTKMTFGTEDGSTGTGFNTDGTGYLATGASISANGYISDWAENDNGFLPTAASGSASTYRCDHVWQNTATYFALVGGSSRSGLPCGAFSAHLGNGAGSRDWGIGAALTYKGVA